MDSRCEFYMRVAFCTLFTRKWVVILLVWFVANSIPIFSQTVFITDNATAETGQNVQITFQLGVDPPWPSNAGIYLTENSTSSLSSLRQIGTCHSSEDYCLQWNNRYNITSDDYNIYVTITSLDRNEDEKYWICRYVMQTGDNTTTLQIFLTVYTFPTAAILEPSFTSFHSLSDGPVTMICKTDKCAYKDPQFHWFMILSNDSTMDFPLGEEILYNLSFSCNDSEKFYFSELFLKENMTFTGNLDLTVRFLCKISFPTLIEDLESFPTDNVSFAVQIESVHLYDGDLAVDGGIITVTENVLHYVSCKPGPSRPSPTYVLVIGAINTTESLNNTFSFIPYTKQHDKEIYCKAYNLQGPEDAIVSKKARIYVQVPVTKLILKDEEVEPTNCDFVNAKEGSPKTLFCESGDSRPSPIFVWYIGNQVRQNHSSNMFTFMPETREHGNVIYCTAHNVDGFQPAMSSKPKLFITGRPAQPRIFLLIGIYGQNVTFYWIAGFNGGFRQTFVIQYKKLGGKEWSNSTMVNESNIRDLNLEMSPPEYTMQIRNLWTDVYEARLIAFNVHGEASPKLIRDSTFQIKLEGDTSLPIQTPSTQTPSPSSVIIYIGAGLGSLILVMSAVIIFLFILLKRTQSRGNITREVTLKEAQEQPMRSGNAYEELKTFSEPLRSAYDSVNARDSKLQRPGVSSVHVYEN